MSEYCKECDSVTIKVSGIDVGFIGLVGFAIIFGVFGYLIADTYTFTLFELLLISSIGFLLILSYSLAYNVFKHSKIQETEK